MKFNILLQYLLPQHALSRLAGMMANSQWHWLKNRLIRYFLNKYPVDLSLAEKESIEDYPSFNYFFTRKLKPELRPIVSDPNQLASPVDGKISQMGQIQQDSLFQAKGFTFHLKALLGGAEELAQLFYDGHFATLYLGPPDYHRVHMPFTGILKETIYVPGQLFSVNESIVRNVPQVFSRNERLICLFDTDIGKMIVILVGAMLVSSIQTVWPLKLPEKTITRKTYTSLIQLKKGDELGLFQLGSTVIVLFQKDAIQWAPHLTEGTVLQVGELLGKRYF